MNIANKLHDTDIVMMRKDPIVFSTSGYDTVGFVFPCHGGGLPIGLKEKLNRININYSTYTYGICSYSGYIGHGLKELDSIITLDYYNYISHHCSCIWLLPHKLMIPPVSIETANKRSKRLSEEIAEDIQNRVCSDKPVPSKLLNKAESKAWPILSSKISKKFSVNNDCVSCGQCVNICPKGNITMVDGKPAFGDKCINCLGCLQYCPTEAINVGQKTEKRERYHNPNISAELLLRSVIHID